MKNLLNLFQNIYTSGVYYIDPMIDVSEISGLAAKENFEYFFIDGKTISTEQDFFNVAEETMHFPYFGNNWDALLDCMRDMSWYSAKGYILVYDDFQVFARNNPKEFHVAIEVLKDATEFWRIDRNNSPVMYLLLRGDKNFASELPVLGEE